MSRVFTIYKVRGIRLHREVETVWLTSSNFNVCGGFIENARWLKCGVLVYRNADGVIVRGIDWRSENEWRNGERKNTERYPTSETARQ